MRNASSTEEPISHTTIHDNTRQYTTIHDNTRQYTTMTMHWSVTSHATVTSQIMTDHRCPTTLISSGGCKCVTTPPLRHLLVARPRVRILLGILMVARPRVRIFIDILYSIAKYYILNCCILIISLRRAGCCCRWNIPRFKLTLPSLIACPPCLPRSVCLMRPMGFSAEYLTFNAMHTNQSHGYKKN